MKESSFPYIKFEQKDANAIKSRIESNLLCDCCSEPIEKNQGNLEFYGYSITDYDSYPYIVHEKCNRIF